MEPVDRKTVLLAKVVIFTEQSRAGDMEGGLAKDKASVAVEVVSSSGNGNDAGMVVRLRFSFQKFT